MASVEDHRVYGEEDLDEDDDEESEEDLNLINPPDDDDDEEDSTSSSNLAAVDPTPSTAGEFTIAITGVPNGEPTQGIAVSIPDPKRQRIEDVSIATVVEEKKPLALDESRRLFQRLWTDEDEIELLQGFLDYSTQRGTNNSSHHLDTTAFYDQIKSKLQLDFNKNQLVEKLRRLKKKYRNVLNKIDLGKEYVFKSSHDQATFEISRKIWCSAAPRGGGGAEEAGLEDDEGKPNLNTNLNDHNNNGIAVNNSEKKLPRPRKRSRAVKIDEKHTSNQQPHQSAAATAPSIPNLIEETVRSCLSPLFKELLHNAMNGPCGSRGLGGLTLNPMPLSFGGHMNFSSGDMVDEKWRKQQILELEVYSKRLELVQDQIKSALEELRPTDCILGGGIIKNILLWLLPAVFSAF
ncbi:hypothetical protein F0562_019815 [Nyssa sinensis]|uniref:Glabrous enhancer-binding protein-like DBD domain-containing protein n=1 Tax=Nyssa sinensis TaxID=561372 RepID=A0A5J5BQ39_9ASTE|nr:hypothetical protein F0562_019815 [Nyssa sinensis]